SHQDHPEGRAVDLMIPRWDTDEGKKFGDEVLDYFRSNAKQFKLQRQNIPIHRPWESLGTTRRGYRKTSLFYTNIIRKCSS
ncbi:MAG: hypothetical protein ACFNW2_07020, partial [Streptococcus sanguinis]